MRSTQLQGLNKDAELLLKEKGVWVECTDVILRKFANGHEETFTVNNIVINPKIIVESYDCFYGMFDEKFSLSRYAFPDGEIIEEYVQETVWSSGPCIFLALRDGKTGKPIAKSLWRKKEINNV